MPCCRPTFGSRTSRMPPAIFTRASAPAARSTSTGSSTRPSSRRSCTATHGTSFLPWTSRPCVRRQGAPRPPRLRGVPGGRLRRRIERPDHSPDRMGSRRRAGRAAASAHRGRRLPAPHGALVRQVDFERLPRHVAIIMDGNGRWAAQRHLPRVEGHRAGIDAVRDVVEIVGAARDRRADALRVLGRELEAPGTEVSTLMALLKRYLRLELNALLSNNIRFRVIGRAEENWRPTSARSCGRRRRPRATPACCSTSR
jgi:hypothetical protein